MSTSLRELAKKCCHAYSLPERNLQDGDMTDQGAHAPPHCLIMSASWPAASHNCLLQAANVPAGGEHSEC